MGSIDAGAQPARLTFRQKISYGVGSLGNNIIYGLMTTYLMAFYTDTFRLAPAAIGTLFFVARTWDAFSDPLIGYVVDNTNTRFGRFRPYLLFGPFVMGTIIILLFSSPNLPPTGKLIWAYATYIGWGMAFAFMDIPFWSMSATLTQDPQERSSLVMVPRTLAIVGIIGANVVTLPLVSALGGQDQKKGWLLVAALFAVLCVVFTLITFFNVKEKTRQAKSEKRTLRDVLRLFRVNRPLRLLIISMLIGDIILAVKSTFTFYYLKYNYNAEDLISVFMGLYAVATIVGSVLAPALAKRFGKKRVAMVGSFVTSMSSIALFFCGYHSLALLILWGMIGGFADGASDIVRMSMLADTVEYGEWKTGKRQEGMIFSTNIFKTKIASAVAGAACAFLLAAVNYAPDAAQSASALNGIHAAYTVIPGAIALLSLIPLARYGLNEDSYLQMLQELKERNSTGRVD